MTLAYWLMIFSSFLIVPLHLGKAQWQSIGPFGCSYNAAFKFDPLTPGKIFANGGGTLFRSDNSGDLWKDITPPVGPSDGEYGIVISALTEGEIYAVSMWNIYRSTDDGDSWIPYYSDSTRFVFFLDKFNPQHLLSYVSRGSGFAGGFVKTVDRSTDGGKHWQTIVDGIDTTVGPVGVWINPNVPDIMFACQAITYGGDVVSGSNFFRSTSGGSHWDTLSTNVHKSFYDIVFDPNDSAIVYLNDWPNGWSRSTDGGLTWNPIGAGISGGVSRRIFISPLNSDVLYAPVFIDTLEQCDIYKSQTGGNTWSRWATASPSQGISTVAVDARRPDLVYIASYPYGAFRSSDEGNSWTNISQGLIQTCVYSCAAASERVVYASVSNTGLEKTTDGGLTWQTLIKDRSTDPGDVKVSRTNPEIVYTNAYMNGGGLSISADGGNSWQTHACGQWSFSEFDVAADDLTIFGSTSQIGGDGTIVAGMVKSTNGGQSWTTVNLGMSGLNNVARIVVDPLHNETVYALVWIRGILSTNLVIKSADGGNHWTKLADSVASFFLNQENPGYLYYTNTSFSNPGSFVSSDGGASFQRIDGDYQITWLASDPRWKMMAYAVTDDGAIIVSSDTGRSWGISPTIDQQVGLKGLRAVSANGGGTLLLAETWTNGVMCYNIKGPSSVQARNEPSRYVLSQNYPNPFNPTTEIEFRVARIGFVSLRVFDVLGREVATLVNEQRHAGIYSVRWDAGSLPSGVYFYQLRAGTFVQTRKLVLVK